MFNLKKFFCLIAVFTVAIIGLYDLSFADNKMDVPLYGQRWSGWSGDRLGTCSNDTIGTSGCAITSTAMVFDYYGMNTDPKSMNNWLKQNVGYSGGCLINWSVAANYSGGDIQWAGIYSYQTIPADMNKIKSELDNGYPVIAEVRLFSSPHFVVITGYSGSTYYINDPWYGDTSTINARYNNNPATAIYGIRLYHGQANNYDPFPKPTLYSPSNGATNVSPTSQNFDWSNVTSNAGTPTYRIVVGTDIDFSGFYDDDENSYCLSSSSCWTKITGSSFYSGFSLNPGTRYYWQVRAGNDNAGGYFSSTGYFTTAASKPDLIVQSQTANPTAIEAGSTISVSCAVKNQGSGSAASSKLKYYLSSNTSYGSSDVYLDYDTVISLASGETGSETETLTIPSGTSPGTWYILFVADANSEVSESNESNNVAYRQITVAAAKPDLIVQSQTVNATAVDAGYTISSSCAVKNQGSGPAGSSRLKYYLSSNASYGSSDVYLSYDTVSSLSSGGTGSESALLTIPLDTSPGTWYILFVADANNEISESNENNNVVYRQITVAAAKPDLIVQSQTVNATAVDAGYTISSSCAVKNQGIGQAGSSTLKYYLSSNTSYGSSDVYLNYDTVSSLSSGGTGSENAPLTIPLDTSQGTWYILFVADANNEVSESNENNNVAYRQITVAAAKPDLIVQSQVVNMTAVEAGSTISSSCAVKNQGIGQAGSSTLKYYLSSNTSYGSSDVYLNYDTVSSLSSGGTGSENAPLTIPLDTSPGTRYILFVADANNEVSESNENNNVVYRQISVTTAKPELTSLMINNGDSATTNQSVTLNHSATSSPTHYMVSENSSFSGAIWRSYSTVPNFTLSSGYGVKTVYFKVKNTGGESNTQSDTINYQEPTPDRPNLTSFMINNGDSATTNQSVTLNHSATSSPTHYMVSENSSFNGAIWRSYSTVPSFTLSSGYGVKTVYFKVKNAGGESNTQSDTINYQEPTPDRPNLTSFMINNGDSATTNQTVTLHHSATNSPTHYMVSENSSFSGAIWRSYSPLPSFTLSSSYGAKTVYFKVKNTGGESGTRSDTISYQEATPDADGDGVSDAEDAFPNDPAEWQDTDHDGTGDNADPDDDNDGLPDDYETAYGLDPLNPDDALLDNDNDGYTNLEESQCGGSDPNDPASVPVCDVTQEIILTKGWNLISLFVEPADTSPAAVFGSIADSLVQVKSASETYTSNFPEYLNDLKEIQVGQGYWVQVNNVALLQITGPPVDVASLSIPLTAEGWNLVGYPLMEEMPVEDALSGIMESLNQVKSGSETYRPGFDFLNDLKILEPNMGYWIDVSADVILQYPTAP